MANTNYDYSDFDVMEFSPFRVPEGKYIYDHYTKLLKRPALFSVPKDVFSAMGEKCPSEKDLDLMVRFVVLFCSKESPLYEEQDYDRRIQLVAGLLNLPENGDTVGKVENNHWWYSEILAAFMETQNNDIFTTWISLKMSMRESQKFLRMSLNDTTNVEQNISQRTKLIASLPDLEAAIAKYEAKIFPASEMAKAAFEAASAPHTQGGWAEKMARDFKPILRK